ncbi:MAG: KOW motif-containing protein [Planctomycetia bacterium]|nr:KOW motif-containing protein [Planctomycetia bacterium]
MTEPPFKAGDRIEVVSGTFEGFQGEVVAVLTDSQTLAIDLDIFGRRAATELEFVDARNRLRLATPS